MRISNFYRTVVKATTFIVLAVSLVALFPVVAEATTLSPTRYELNGDPGKTTQATIKIYNDEKIRRTYYLSAARFESQGENGDPVFVPDDKDGLVSWFGFPDSVEVGAQQYQEVNVTVKVPSNAEPGGYFAAVFASIIPPTPGDTSMVAVQSDVGTLILFRVNGEIPQNDSILEFDTKNKKHWYANIPVEFYFRFQNSGGDRAQPLGDITVKNIFGGIAKIITGNKGAGNVLPQSTRRFESAWVTTGDDQVEKHTGAVEYPKFSGYWSHVKYEWNNFAFGRYRADLNVTVNNDSSRTHAKSVAFWVVPWHLLLLVLVVAGLFFGIVLAVVLIIVLLVIRRKKR